jgi:hypothetical protein
MTLGKKIRLKAIKRARLAGKRQKKTAASQPPQIYPGFFPLLFTA